MPYYLIRLNRSCSLIQVLNLIRPKMKMSSINHIKESVFFFCVPSVWLMPIYRRITLGAFLVSCFPLTSNGMIINPAARHVGSLCHTCQVLPPEPLLYIHSFIEYSRPIRSGASVIYIWRERFLKKKKTNYIIGPDMTFRLSKLLPVRFFNTIIVLVISSIVLRLDECKYSTGLAVLSP